MTLMVTGKEPKMPPITLARLMPLTGAAFFVLILVALIIEGSPPAADDATDDVVRWWTDNDTRSLTAAQLGGLASALLVWFGGSMRATLRRAEGEPGRVAAIAFGGFLLAGLGNASLFGFSFAAAETAGDVPAEVTHTLSVLSELFFIPFAMGLLVALLATSVVILRHGGPRGGMRGWASASGGRPRPSGASCGPGREPIEDCGRTAGSAQRRLPAHGTSSPSALLPGRATHGPDCHPPARIWSPRGGVHDVADEGFELRRGRVIWSVSTTYTTPPTPTAEGIAIDRDRSVNSRSPTLSAREPALRPRAPWRRWPPAVPSPTRRQPSFGSARGRVLNTEPAARSLAVRPASLVRRRAVASRTCPRRRHPSHRLAGDTDSR